MSVSWKATVMVCVGLSAIGGVSWSLWRGILWLQTRADRVVVEQQIEAARSWTLDASRKESVDRLEVHTREQTLQFKALHDSQIELKDTTKQILRVLLRDRGP